MIKRTLRNSAGFTFIEMALVLIVVGLLAGTGLLLVGKKVEAVQRKEALLKLEDARKGLLFYAANRGSSPLSYNQNQSNDQTNNYWYIHTGLLPFDPWNKLIKYVVSANVDPTQGVSQLDICRRLKNPQGYVGWGGGGWIDLDDTIDGEHYQPAGAGTKIAALFISGGGKDIDGANGMLDGGSAGPNYVRKYPADDFDDIVVKVKADDLYLAIKDTFCTATVTVTDNRAVGDLYYVYNRTTLKDIGSGNWKDTITVRVPFDDTLEIHALANAGDASLVSATITATTTINIP